MILATGSDWTPVLLAFIAGLGTAIPVFLTYRLLRKRDQAEERAEIRHERHG